MNNFGDKVSFIWSVADLLRDSFKRAKYPDVILPLTVLRRLDCVLEPAKGKVLETHAKLKGRLENLGKRPAIPFVQCAAGNGPAFPGVGLDLYFHGG